MLLSHLRKALASHVTPTSTHHFLLVNSTPRDDSQAFNSRSLKVLGYCLGDSLSPVLLESILPWMPMPDLIFICIPNLRQSLGLTEVYGANS